MCLGRSRAPRSHGWVDNRGGSPTWMISERPAEVEIAPSRPLEGDLLLARPQVADRDAGRALHPVRDPRRLGAPPPCSRRRARRTDRRSPHLRRSLPTNLPSAHHVHEPARAVYFCTHTPPQRLHNTNPLAIPPPPSSTPPPPYQSHQLNPHTPHTKLSLSHITYPHPQPHHTPHPPLHHYHHITHTQHHSSNHHVR